MNSWTAASPYSTPPRVTRPRASPTSAASERDLIPGQLARGSVGRVGADPQRQRRAVDLVEDDARPERDARSLHDVLLRRAVVRRQRRRGALRVPLELVELGIDELLLEERHDQQAGDEQRAPDDQEQAEGEPRADPARHPHASRKR